MSRIEEVREAVLAHPFHKACELALDSAGDGHATVSFAVNEFTGNPQGSLHGGILYALMDVACFFAAVSKLPAGRHPVSVEVNTSVLRAAGVGDRVIIEAWADRVGRSLASMRAEARTGAGKLIATGTVTKAILDA